MPCIEMPEVACLYRYLLVSALVNTPECGPILAYFAVMDIHSAHGTRLGMP